MTERSKKLVGWMGLNLAQYLSFYAGVTYDLPNALGASICMTWFQIGVVLILCIWWSTYTQMLARKHQRCAIGDAPSPWLVDFLMDSVFAVYLIHEGWWLTGFFFLVHAILVSQLRAKAKKFNDGLIELVAIPPRG